METFEIEIPQGAELFDGFESRAVPIPTWLIVIATDKVAARDIGSRLFATSVNGVRMEDLLEGSSNYSEGAGRVVQRINSFLGSIEIVGGVMIRTHASRESRTIVREGSKERVLMVTRLVEETFDYDETVVRIAGEIQALF